MFDVPITYIKGPAVLWMIEQYIGHDRFRDGVRRYLQANSYGNAETTDLWDALEAENPDVPLRAVMDSWVFQSGFPIVTVTTLPSGNGDVELTQEPFSYLPAEGDTDPATRRRWLIPVLAAPVGDRSEVSRLLLAEKPMRLAGGSSPLLVNAGGTGFFRVGLDAALRARLLEHLGQLDPIERLGLAGDLWAAVLAGVTGLGEFLAALAHFAGEDDPYIWTVLTTALRTIHSSRPLMTARFFRATLAAVGAGAGARPAGWEQSPGEGEKAPVLRATLIAALGTFGEDEDVLARARQLFAADQSGTRELDADIAGALSSPPSPGTPGGRTSTGSSRAAAIHVPPRRASLPQRPRLPTDPGYAAEVHELCRGEIRSQDARLILLAIMLGQRVIGPVTWKFISSNYADLAAWYPENSLHRMLEGMAGLAELDDEGRPVYEAAVRSFVEATFSGGQKRLLDQTVEHLEVNVRLARTARTTLRAALSHP